MKKGTEEDRGRVFQVNIKQLSKVGMSITKL